jgi:hypothetical protein
MIHSLMRSLQHVFWIGGSACGGKTSTAQLLADDYGLRVYSCDEAYTQHRWRVDPRWHPCFHRIMNKDFNQLFMPPAEEQVAEVIGFYQEQFDMVLADLLALPQSVPILVEGAGLLPPRVFEVLAEPHHAAWLVPTAEFRATLTRLEDPAVWELVGKTDDPVRAFRNWMARDVLFSHWVVSEACALGLQVLVNDGRQTIPQRAAVVARHFGL